MQFFSFFVFFSLLASLVSGVVANTLYRGDTRGPRTIKAAGGFKAKGFGREHGTVIEHVTSTLKYPSRDPFISTSTDINAAKTHAGNGFLYTLDASKIKHDIIDVAAEFRKTNDKYGHAWEKEFSVRTEIPWAAVTKVQQKRDGEWKTIKMPTKRAPEFPAEYVFVE